MSFRWSASRHEREVRHVAAEVPEAIFPILAGRMIELLGGIPRTAMTFGVVYVLGLIVPWFLPETRGKPLPE